jgi:hypothetical protein
MNVIFIEFCSASQVAISITSYLVQIVFCSLFWLFMRAPLIVADRLLVI